MGWDVIYCDRLSNFNLCMHFNIQNYLPPSPLLSLTSPQMFYANLLFTQYLIFDLTGISDLIDIFLTSHSSAAVHTALRTATGRRRPERYHPPHLSAPLLCAVLCSPLLLSYFLFSLLSFSSPHLVVCVPIRLRVYPCKILFIYMYVCVHLYVCLCIYIPIYLMQHRVRLLHNIM